MRLYNSAWPKQPFKCPGGYFAYASGFVSYWAALRSYGKQYAGKNTPEFAFATHMVGHVGLITPTDMTLETAEILPPLQDGFPQQRQQAAELNRAMYV